MADDQIITKLNREPTDDPRIIACRNILKLTGQWPWEWAEDFEPKKWTMNIVGDLRILLDGIRYKVAVDPSLTSNNFKKVKDFLRGQACERDAEHPQLQYQDVQHALEHFKVGVSRKKTVKQEVPCPAPMAEMAPEPIAPVARRPAAVVADNSGQVDEGIECDPPSSPLVPEHEETSSENGSDAMSISRENSAETSPESPPSPKTPVMGLPNRKRVRTVEEEISFEMQIYTVVSIEPSPLEATEPETNDTVSL
jgi:hypothetical protein